MRNARSIRKLRIIMYLDESAAATAAQLYAEAVRITQIGRQRAFQ